MMAILTKEYEIIRAFVHNDRNAAWGTCRGAVRDTTLMPLTICEVQQVLWFDSPDTVDFHGNSPSKEWRNQNVRPFKAGAAQAALYRTPGETWLRCGLHPAFPLLALRVPPHH